MHGSLGNVRVNQREGTLVLGESVMELSGEGGAAKKKLAGNKSELITASKES